MPGWMEDWLQLVGDVMREVLPILVGALVVFVLVAFAFGVLSIGWRSLGGVWRRQERGLCLVTLLDIGLENGRTPEQILLSLEAGRVSEMGPQFKALVAQVREGKRLGVALEAVPQLLSPGVRAMIQVGEELGDLRRVLPACRLLLREGTGQSHSVMNNLMVLLFVSPAGPLLVWFMSVFVYPKFKAIALDMTISGAQGMSFWFESSVLVAEIITALWILLWLVNWLRNPQSWLYKFPGAVLPRFVQEVNFWLPWCRRRMARDFSTMLTLLLDAGVPEERALRLAGTCAANSVFTRRVQRVIADLQQGVKLTEAVRWLDDRGEFRWRLCNAAEKPHTFAASLAGWHETLDAKAFQQEQTVSQLVTTGFVFLNGTLVALVAVGSFQLLLAIIEEAGW